MYRERNAKVQVYMLSVLRIIPFDIGYHYFNYYDIYLCIKDDDNMLFICYFIIFFSLMKIFDHNIDFTR